MNKIPYATQWIDGSDIKAAVKVLKSAYLTQGPMVDMFEKAIADYCGAKYAVAVSNGTAALHAAAFAAGIGPGDEVITSPITFVASANCILYCGGRPVFADIQEDSINIDPKEIEKKVTAKTRAVIPVHLAGHPCDLQEIKAIAKRHHLVVIEDAAHAFAAEYKGSRIGSCKYSDMTIFSFHPVKHITSGEGGMILTNNRDYYEKLLLFRTHGITRYPKMIINQSHGGWYYEMQCLGFNYRITDFQCALGISQLKKSDQFIKKRRKIASRYNKAFKKVPGLIIIKEKEYVKSSCHLYLIQVENRKRIFDKLRQAGILVNVHYIPVYRQPYYQKLGYSKWSCPNAERYYERTISLPMFPKLSDKELEYVIGTVIDTVRNN